MAGWDNIGTGLTSSVSETILDDGTGNLTPGKIYRITYYIRVTDPILAGTLQLVIRWSDGASSRLMAPTAILLTGVNYMQGHVIVRMPDGDPIPSPTFEIVLASLLGTPTFDYNIHLGYANS